MLYLILIKILEIAIVNIIMLVKINNEFVKSFLVLVISYTSVIYNYNIQKLNNASYFVINALLNTILMGIMFLYIFRLEFIISFYMFH